MARRVGLVRLYAFTARAISNMPSTANMRPTIVYAAMGSITGAGAVEVWGAAEVDGVAPPVTLATRDEIRELMRPSLFSRPCRPDELMLATSGAHLPFGAPRLLIRIFNWIYCLLLRLRYSRDRAFLFDGDVKCSSRGPAAVCKV